jgi:ribosomal protein S18 acetylase RimI-like enzyme
MSAAPDGLKHRACLLCAACTGPAALCGVRAKTDARQKRQCRVFDNPWRIRATCNMTAFQIRPASASDAQAITQIESATAKALGHAQVDAATRLRFWKEAVEFGEPLVQVAVRGDTVIGFVGYDRSRDPRTPPTTGEIWAIHVRADDHGQGVGLALWDAAREGLCDEGCTHVSIWIELASERALRFHELAGFKRDMPSLRTVARGTRRVEEIRLKRVLG